MATLTVSRSDKTTRPDSTLATLRGRGHGNRSILATTVTLGESDGRLTLSSELLAEAAKNARGSEDSWREVIVVAQSGPSALLLPMPEGIKMVGIVSEQEIPAGVTTAVPVVSGVADAREQIAEGSLVLLDPVRGRVLVEPDAREMAAMQATTHRPRFRMGAAHVPALTQGGRAVSVFALVNALSEVEEALLAGADGLFIPLSSELLVSLLDENAGNALRPLLQLSEAFGGGALTLALSIEMFSPVVLVRLAAHSLLRVAIHPADLPLSPEDMHFEMEKIVQQEIHATRKAARFGLAALAPDLEAPDTAHFDEIYLAAETIASMTPEQIFALPPVFALFDNPFDDSLTGFEETISAGVAGVVVSISRIAEAKSGIREHE